MNISRHEWRLHNENIHRCAPYQDNGKSTATVPLKNKKHQPKKRNIHNTLQMFINVLSNHCSTDTKILFVTKKSIKNFRIKIITHVKLEFNTSCMIFYLHLNMIRFLYLWNVLSPIILTDINIWLVNTKCNKKIIW